MTFEAATLSDFRAAFDFASFADVDDAFVTQALERGIPRVEGWINDDESKLGTMLYAAHELTIAGLGSGAEATLGKEGLLGFTSIRSGGLNVTRAASTGSDGGSGSDLNQTQYGRRFLALARMNILGPRVAAP